MSATETSRVPWILQRHFDAEIDLDQELNIRFQSMPVLSTLKARELDRAHGTALLATQDGAASVRVDVDLESNTVDFVFILRAMLGLHFGLVGMGERAHAHWLSQMRETQGRPVFFWGARRWGSDYLIMVPHQYYTNVFAFSALGYEAAARMTPDVKNQLLDWLEDLWQLGASLDPTVPAR
jgi:hypothetical protein